MDTVVPLVEECLPCPEPWEVARRLANRSHLLFLDSAEIDLSRGRYSFISADPSLWWREEATSPFACDPFSRIAAELQRFPLTTLPDLPPFQGGCAGQWGYGLNRLLERIPPNRVDEFHIPDLAVGFYDWVIAFDHAQQRAWLISTGYPECDERKRHQRAHARIEEVREWLRQPPVDVPRRIVAPLAPGELAALSPLPEHRKVYSNFDRSAYLEVIARAVEYVHAGDCFQVNIAQRLIAPERERPLDLYARLRERNPAPFAGYLDLGDFVIASASPERFLQVQRGVVETRPIKGTRPRGQTPEEDRLRYEELASSAKDRAENVMIVDLLRNDLGRVCRYGSVRVPRVCEVESYRFVHHLVSTVVGELRADCTAAMLLRAAFPGGSVTGAPKVRAMEIIAELEPTARGPYCGSLGYIGFDGSMDTNILIRTFTCGRGWVQFPVGGGIVADSDPVREYDETLHKATGLLRSLEV